MHDSKDLWSRSPLMTVHHSEEVSLRARPELPDNMAHIRQSRPESGLGFQVKNLIPFQAVSSSLVGDIFCSKKRKRKLDSKDLCRRIAPMAVHDSEEVCAGASPEHRATLRRDQRVHNLVKGVVKGPN